MWSDQVRLAVIVTLRYLYESTASIRPLPIEYENTDNDYFRVKQFNLHFDLFSDISQLLYHVLTLFKSLCST